MWVFLVSKIVQLVEEPLNLCIYFQLGSIVVNWYFIFTSWREKESKTYTVTIFWETVHV